MNIKYTFLFFSVLLLLSCEKKEDPFKLETLDSKGGFPQIPQNLSIFNSVYDDYNSDIEPGMYDNNTFVFSSNRNSKGRDFDFVLYSMGITYLYDKNVVSVYKSSNGTSLSGTVESMLLNINTSSNQFGPYIYPLTYDINHAAEEFIFFYTQETNGTADIKYMLYRVTKSGYYTFGKTEGPYDLKLINTPKNESYISISNNKIYYCSDKDGNYDIYQLPIDTTKNIVDFLSGEYSDKSEKIDILNSDKDDKCPFVKDNLMVFTSNRDGGLGGYDLYYSKFNGTNWEKPTNFGPNYNSEADEFRPIIVKYSKVPNDLMIFSSNRKGGLGGFDLYYTGTDLLRK